MSAWGAVGLEGLTSAGAYGGARLCLGEARLTRGEERVLWLAKAVQWRDYARLIRKREQRERSRTAA